MKRWIVVWVLFIAVIGARPSAARVNMLEPWSPGLDFTIPQTFWNHDVHMRSGFGKKGTDLFELGYVLTTPVSPDWEAGGGLNYQSLDTPAGSESGLGDLFLGAKYKLPEGHLPQALQLCGEAGLTLPTGHADKGLGAGGVGLFLGGDFQGAMSDNVTGYTHLGFRVYSKGQDTHWGGIVEYALGVKYLIDGEWLATTDVRAFNHGRDEHKGIKSDGTEEIYLVPGAIYRPSRLPAEFLGSILLGLTGDSYDFGLQISAKF
jgi:hypothetical protein